MERNNITNQPSNIKIYYRNQYHINYKTDERILKEIINGGIESKGEKNTNVIIYYKNNKVSNLIMQNNLSTKYDKLQQTNVVYKFSKVAEGSEPLDAHYIGMTTTTLSRRLTMHLQEGSIKQYSNNNNLALN